MRLKPSLRTIPTVTLAVVLASCGGGGDDMSPIIGAANPDSVTDTNEPSAANPTLRTVSGRVADGYINGATVCIDLNDNLACDDDEPSALTGEGGTYDLVIPLGAENSAIVADIPEDAIDEDTGEAIGRALVFTAPAEQPEFISPITTLVHNELKNNPSLELEDAEAAVKDTLGLTDSDISLFADFIAGGRNASQDTAQKSELTLLHDTARVITSMMKDIEQRVEVEAQKDGIDVSGSTEIRNAIRALVSQEVRKLLPEAVERIATLAGPQSPGVQTSALDPAAIAASLSRDNVLENLPQRITAAQTEAQVARADAKQLLTDGIYIVEHECGEDENNASPECLAYYSTLQLSAQGGELLIENFEFDSESGLWTKEASDDALGDYVLIDGEWKNFPNNSPLAESATFNDDGSTTLVGQEGTITFNAATQTLGATPVQNHIWESGTNTAWLNFVQEADMFPSGAKAHLITFRNDNLPYTMFNFNEGYEDDNGSAARCIPYAGNCNVVGDAELSSQNFMPSMSLSSIRQQAADTGAWLTGLNGYFGPANNVILNAAITDDGLLPESGTVTWETLQDTSAYGVCLGELSVIENGFTATELSQEAYDALYQVYLGKATECDDIQNQDGTVDSDFDTDNESTPGGQVITDADQAAYNICLDEQLAIELGFSDNNLSPTDEAYAALYEKYLEKSDECNAILNQEKGGDSNVDTGGKVTPNGEVITDTSHTAYDICVDEQFELELGLGNEDLSQEENDALYEKYLEKSDQCNAILNQSNGGDEGNGGALVPGGELTSGNDHAAYDICLDELFEIEMGFGNENLSQEENDALYEVYLKKANDCEVIQTQTSTAGTGGEFVQSDNASSTGSQSLTATWRLIDVDGVQMIEITIPNRFASQASEQNNNILLIEHEGVVRMGERLPATEVDQFVAYNDIASMTLRALIERSANNK